MNKTRVLVLGNDPFINKIDFTKLDPSVITIGVNRIWLKHIPNYLFFHDWNIVIELLNNPQILEEIKSNSFVYSSNYLFKKNTNITSPDWINMYPVLNPKSFPDSVTNAINSFNTNIKTSKLIDFYIAGVSLRWQEPSHFWKELDYPGRNSADALWYTPRFKLILRNFVNLQEIGLSLTSVTPNSMLNKIMRYERIENLYVK